SLMLFSSSHSVILFYLLYLMVPRPPTSTLFPYTTLFRSYSSEFSAVAWTVYMLVAGNAMLVCMLWMNGRYILQIKKADENYIFRSEEHTSELQSRENLVCRLLLEKKNSINFINQKKLFKV